MSSLYWQMLSKQEQGTIPWTDSYWVENYDRQHALRPSSTNAPPLPVYSESDKQPEGHYFSQAQDDRLMVIAKITHTDTDTHQTTLTCCTMPQYMSKTEADDLIARSMRASMKRKSNIPKGWTCSIDSFHQLSTNLDHDSCASICTSAKETLRWWERWVRSHQFVRAIENVKDLRKGAEVEMEAKAEMEARAEARGRKRSLR